MNIAVFLPNWIGDVVMATPALRALRNNFSDARLTGVMRPYVAGVLEGSPWFDEQLFLDTKGPWSRRWPALAWKLRRRRVDLAVLFTNSFRTGLVAWLGGCKRIVGYRRYGRGWMLSTRLEPVRDEKGRLKPSPVIDAYNLLASSVGCADPGYRMELFSTQGYEEAAAAVWEQAGFTDIAEVICLNPGAAFGSAKHWGLESFVRLAQDLADRRRSGVLVLCGPQEREMASSIARLAKRPGVLALGDICAECGRAGAKRQAAPALSLGLTKACVRRADLLITTDSGPRHFAAAFERPVVTLFGPTHIPWTETYYARAINLQKRVECGPCQLRVCPLDHRCMRLLSPEEVYAAATDLLERFPPKVMRKAS